MATIDIKLKTYEQLQFEIMKLNTDIVLKDKEIERLNNIINELEEELEREINFGKTIPKEANNYNSSLDIRHTLEKVLERLKELKEGKENQKRKCSKLKLNKEAKKLYEGFKNIYKLPNGKDIRDLIKKLEAIKKEVE